MEEQDERYYRDHPMTNETLRQFCKGDGPRAHSDAYKLRHMYTFSFTEEQRRQVDALVLEGHTLEGAIMTVMP